MPPCCRLPQVVLLPVVAGAAVNTAFPKQVASLAPLSALSAVVLIALICGSVMAQNAAAVLAAGPQLLGAVAALHAGGFFAGYAISRALGIPERAARTNSIEVGMQVCARWLTAHLVPPSLCRPGRPDICDKTIGRLCTASD
jgi:predicted Na+-dependent transporter